MQFAHPENLWSLLILLPMLGSYVGWWWWKARRMEDLGETSLLRAMASAQSARRQVARAVFALLGTTLLCLALAQPQWGQTHRPIKRTGVDVVFALDLSTSMNAQDIAPTRLEAAKNEIETTLEVLRGDRVGLVVFTAVSFVQSPLTTDYGAIRFYLDRLAPGQMPLGGTSLGRAITDAVELLTGKRMQSEADIADVDMPRAKNQVVVLITDGEDHESDPHGAAKLAATNNIRVVTVGLGSEDGSRIPVFRPDGKLSGYKRDRDGNFVQTKLDSGTLRTVAETTGGEYVPYEGENSVANALVAYINDLEKTEIESLLKERYRERYMFFAIPGLMLLLLSLLLGERRRGTGRKAASVALMSVLLLFGGSGCERAFEDTLSSVDRGNELLEEDKYQEALEAYRQAETEIPARPELHYDIGRALLGLEQWSDAADAFARALDTDNVSLRFDALFNLGLAHAGQEAWLEAWETYREALSLAERNPGQVDPERLTEARWNLEVAWRRFFPPCRELEDANEENDAPDTATKLEEPKVDKATLCGLDDDWYVIQAIPGTRVSVSAQFRELRQDPEETRSFLPNANDLQIALFDHTGQNILVVDKGADDTAGATTASRTIDRFQVDETMVSGEMPFVLLKVSAAERLEFEYDLTIESIPPCHALEEDAEDNDNPEQAKLLEAGNHQMHHCSGDDDWFYVDATVGDSVFIDVQTPPDAEREVPANLDLTIFDTQGRSLAEGEREGAYLTAGVRSLRNDQRLLVRVAGATDDEQGPYQLDVYQYEPCILGDDRFEENDTPNAASPLDRTQPVHRYLRACDGDLDYFRLDFTEDEDADERKVAMGLARISTPAPGADPTDEPPFQFDMVSASGGQILVPGDKPAAPALQDPTAEPEQPQLPLAMVIQTDDITGDSAILRVAGEQEFYHLVQLDPQQKNQDGEQDQDEPQDGEDEPSESEENKDGESGEDDQESKEEESSDEGEPEEQKPEPEEAEQEKPDEGEQKRPGEQEEAERERIEDILEALEQTDDNFQMRKALENVPGRYIEKDW